MSKQEAGAELDEQHIALYFALMESAALLQQLMDEQTRRDGDVTYVQFTLLARLGGSPGGSMRMTDLADSLVHSRSGLTYQAGLLEKAGLLVRSRSESDERSVHARLTEDGRAVLARILPGHQTLVARGLFDAIDPDSVAELASTFASVRASLRSLAPAASARRRRRA